MNTPREFQALHAEHRAREALAQARSTLERALRELDRYTARFDEAESLRDKADVMNWTLNELACNITPNLRLDLIASAQAELVRADRMADCGPPGPSAKRSNRHLASISNSALLRVSQRSTTRIQR